jgi:maltose O-acetyltransferase
MRRFLSRQARSVLKRCRALSLWFDGRDDRVLKEGQLILNAPLRCDGQGRVALGADVAIGFELAPILGDGQVRLHARGVDARISVGAGTAFSNNVNVIACQSVSIGRRCLIGDAVLIFDSDFHHLSAEGRHTLPGAVAPVVLEDNVFVGSRAIILKGVTIGKDSVIGAGSVVVRSIPPGVIAAGNPAKVIRPL